MTTAHDVMAYIRQVRPDAGRMERQKFLYYIQAWHAAWEGSPLYPERIEAWPHGPVCRDTWTAEKYHDAPAAHPLGDHAKAVVDSVLAFYGHYTAAQLRALSHNEGPWIKARGDLPEGVPSNAEVTVSDMRRYFTRKSIAREPAPCRPPIVRAPSAEATAAAGREVVARWRKALDELAVR